MGGNHVSETTCPSCGTELADGKTIAGRREIDSPTVSICRSCAEIILVTGRGLVLRAISAREFLGLNDEAQTTLRVAFELVRRRRTSAPPTRHLN